MMLQHFPVLLALVNHSFQVVKYATSDHGILHTKAVVVLIKPFCTEAKEDILGNCQPSYGAGRHLLGGGQAGGGGEGGHFSSGPIHNLHLDLELI